MPYTDLAGKCALVTGAGSGLGKAAALMLAKQGVKIGLLGLSPNKLEATQSEITALGGESIVLQADISNAEAMDAAADKLYDTFGRVDIVFANAGINGKWTLIDDFEPGEWEKTIRVNLIGTYHTIRCVASRMKQSGNGGSIIITSSINGYRTFENIGASAYSASKAGQIALSNMLALELAKERIRVNTLCPGAIKTQIGKSTLRDEDVKPVREYNHIPKAFIPLTNGVPGKPEDVAKLVCFLASEEASGHISGSTITIDGAESLLYG